MMVKKVPQTRLPAGMQWMVKAKRTSVDPLKIQDAKIHKDPPGLNGDLLEGRYYHDAFVLGARANGIYVSAATATVTANPNIVVTTAGQFTITGGGSGVKYYTIDGTDPRYSRSAKPYSAAVTGLPAGTVVRAFAAPVNPIHFNSAVVRAVTT